MVSLDVKNSFDMHRKPIRGPENVTWPLLVQSVFDVKTAYNFMCFHALAFTRERRLRLTSGAPSGGDVNAAPSEHGRSATRRETPFTCMSYNKLHSFRPS
ncbi:hypothetical protein OUZ56_005248 [Daphnia magna]|uniref:Uncharacterized protein n=1 Tax=Daphnia magna TaxID=35525 RepID=A0ABQ9YS93_9CRUS|nr:hypothetical protein OUZ56_005248 [Daphnia magna]